MSKAGNFAAYQSGPTTEDFGDNMLQAENQQFKYRQEQRVEDQIKYKKRKEAEDAYKADLEKQKFVQTGFEPMDKLYTRFTFSNMEQLGENHRLLNSGNLSRKQRQEILYQNSMLNKMPEFLQSVSKHATDYATTVSKGLKDGTLSGAVEGELATVRAMFEGRFKDLKTVDGMPVATVVNEDGEEIEVNYGEVINGFRFNTADLPQRVDDAEWIKTEVESLGKREVADSQGGMIGVAQTFEPHREFVSKSLDARLGNAKNPSDLAVSMWVDTLGNSMKTFGPDAIQRVKGHLMNEVEKSYDQTFSGSQWREYDSNSGNGGEEKNKPLILDAQLVTDTTGKPSQEAAVSPFGPRREEYIEGPVKEYTLKTKGGEPIKGVISENPETEILTVIENEGEFWANVRTTSDYTETKKSGGDILSMDGGSEGSIRRKSSSTEVRKVKLSDTEANRLARQFGLNNAAELNQYLSQKSGVQQSQPTASGNEEDPLDLNF